MNLPLSHILFLKNISAIEFRNPELSYKILLLGFYELILNNIIEVNCINENIIISKKNNTENKFYNLLINPIQNSNLPLQKY